MVYNDFSKEHYIVLSPLENKIDMPLNNVQVTCISRVLRDISNRLRLCTVLWK